MGQNVRLWLICPQLFQVSVADVVYTDATTTTGQQAHVAVVNGHPGSSAVVPSAQSVQSASSSEEQPLLRTPLSTVVTDAVKRWYIDTNKEAVKGDVVRPS